MPTASLTAKTFTPLSGGPSEITTDAPAAHTKSDSVWNRFKRGLQSVQFNSKKFGNDESRLRGADGNFWKLTAANEYVAKLESELAAAKGIGSSNDATLKAENVRLTAEVARLTKANAELAANTAPPKPREPDIRKLCTAVYGESRTNAIERNARDAGMTFDRLARRNFQQDDLKVAGLDLSEAEQSLGKPKEAFGLIRVSRSDLQRKADAFMAKQAS